MKFDLGQIKKLTVITVEMSNEGTSYAYEMIGFKKGELNFIKAKKRIADEVQLIKDVKDKYPIILHFMGKGVLNRQTQNTPGYRSTLLMNINLEEFYFTDFVQGDTVFSSVVRKDLVEEQLEIFAAKKLHVIQVTSGPFVIGPIAEYLNKKQFNSNGIKLSFSEKNELSSFEKEEGDLRNIEIGEDLVSTDRLEPIAVAANFFNPSKTILLPENEEVFLTNLEEAKQKNIFQRFGVGMVAIFVVIILSNYLYLNSLNTTISENYLQLSAFEEQLALVGDLEDEKNRKEKLLRSSGLLNRHFLSFYLSELGKDVPREMNFEYVDVRPLSDEIKNKHKIEFQDRIIFIKGKSENSNVLSNWIEEVKEKEWITSVEIMNYTYERNAGNFELEIVVI